MRGTAVAEGPGLGFGNNAAALTLARVGAGWPAAYAAVAVGLLVLECIDQLRALLLAAAEGV